jgi:FtsH-binding integral membrane protein
MARFGQYTLIVGLILTIISLILGFWYMFHNQDEWAKLFFMVVPVGFLLTFAGLSTVVLYSPRDNAK